MKDLKVLSGILAIFFVLLAGAGCECKKDQPETYMVFGNAYQMTCKMSIRNYCGVTLRDCDDGNEYECMTNLIRVK